MKIQTLTNEAREVSQKPQAKQNDIRHYGMTKHGNTEKTIEGFIEDQRLQMMKRMHNANRQSSSTF